mmetsp:Transcript_21757/g.67585  ORF Transcript_21757/g.67585 Transcript_21757/m.67585 type:complete len:226 (+) Transcript_21757:346-1023(+)
MSVRRWSSAGRASKPRDAPRIREQEKRSRIRSAGSLAKCRAYSSPAGASASAKFPRRSVCNERTPEDGSKAKARHDVAMIAASTCASRKDNAGRPQRNDHAPSLCNIPGDLARVTVRSNGRLVGGTTVAVIGGMRAQSLTESVSRAAAWPRLLHTFSSAVTHETRVSKRCRRQRRSRKNVRASEASDTPRNIPFTAHGSAAFNAAADSEAPVLLLTDRCRRELFP